MNCIVFDIKCVQIVNTRASMYRKNLSLVLQADIVVSTDVGVEQSQPGTPIGLCLE